MKLEKWARKRLQISLKVSSDRVSKVLGALQDISAIGKVVSETEAVFVADTCQTAGVVPLDMAAQSIDVLVFTGNKGVFGPMGIGGMVVSPGVEIRPARFGGTGVDSITPFLPADYPHRLETGTPPVTGIAGLNAGQKWFAELGHVRLQDSGADHRAAALAALEQIHEVENGHVSALLRAIAATDNVTAYGTGDNAPRVATLSVNFGEVPADQAGAMLDADFGLCVRAGLHCAPLVHEDRGLVPQHGAVRFSPGYFTDDEDISVACEAIQEM
jgi:cysteine desulfurase/selenocysteine lyase